MSRYQLDGYSALEGVRRELASFLQSTFRFASPQLDAAVHRLIQDQGLLAPKVVEPTFPYEEPVEAPRTLAELAAAGLVHPELVRLLEKAEGDAQWPASRPLYSHQVEAIKSHRQGKSLVIASGTGSGKTECFLFPTIDTVLRDPDLTRPGIRVLLVYPLNALVNNQMDRLRAILGDHPKIRFALYTRRLAETQKLAERKLRNSGRRGHPAEVISREVLRAHPPHIVVTNFSMLEYALVRPADSPLFADRVERPRLCVLDEAHVYAGSLAAELTLLLRRAWLRWGFEQPPQGIVTSATMHQGIDDGPERLLKFATDLLSKAPGDVIPISGRRVLPPDEAQTLDAPLPSAASLAAIDVNFPTLRDEKAADGTPQIEFETNDDARKGVGAVLQALGRSDVRGGVPALDLWNALEPLSWVRALRRDLHEARVGRIDTLSSALFPGDSADLRERALLNLLAILAVARRTPTGLPLMPVRLHGVVRGPHGVFACLNASCDNATVSGRLGALYPDHVVGCACGATTLELRVCEGCGQSYLGAARDGQDDEGLPALVAAGRDIDLFVPGNTWDDGSTIEGGTVVRAYPTGRIAGDGEGAAWTRFDGGTLRATTQQLVGVACPRCEAQIPGGSVLRRIEVGTDAALQVVVDGLYPWLPKHPDAGTLKLPGEGRRALLFADNRQIAAALAAKVEESHDILLARVLLMRSLESALKNAASPELARLQSQQIEALRDGRLEDAQRLMDEIRREAQKPAAASVSYDQLRNTLAAREDLAELSTFRPGQQDDLAQMVLTRELGRRPARRGNLEATGAIAIAYQLSVPAPSHPDVRAGFSPGDWTSLVEVLLDVVRTSGIVRPPVLSWQARQQVQLKLLGKKLVRSLARDDADDEEDEESEGKSSIAFLPTSITGMTRSIEYVAKVLAKRSLPPTVQPLLLLEQVWEALLAAARVSDSSLVAEGEGILLPIQGLRFQTAARTDQWRCGTCKTVWARQVDSVCPTSGCNGVLNMLERGVLDSRERLLMLTKGNEPLLGLRTEEHTAQIGVERLEEREQDFKSGKVNVLTSSTTMELGIDIGGLSATLLTNVPPGASNYLQRAGRAGRRAEGTSLVLTYARPRPFDQASFLDPLRPFRERIVPPVVRLDADRIIRRHVNAFLLAHFFRDYEAQGDVPSDPMSALRTANDFFFRPLTDVFAGDASAQDLLELAPATGATLSDAFHAWLSAAAAEDEVVKAAGPKLVRGTSLEPEEILAMCATSAAQLARIAVNAREQHAFLQNRIDEEGRRSEQKRDSGAITALELQKTDLESAKLLAYLAEEQYLPRYGFPVQVVSLDHRFRPTEKEYRRVEEDDADLRLSRDISLAISEYAPGAEIVAGKEVHRSSGLLRHWTGTDAPGVLANRYVAVCAMCGQLQYGRTEGEIRTPCPTCREGVPRLIRVLEPRQGFAVRWGIRPKRWISGTRPPLRPVTEAAYAARDGQSIVEVSSGLCLGYDPEGQILLRAEGQLDPTDLPGAGASEGGAPRAGYGYAVCYLCGRAEPEEPPRGRSTPIPKALQKHYRLRGDARCEATSEYWRNTVLAGAVRTETLDFQLRGPLQFPPGVQGRRWATTWMVALQLSAGEVLGIDSRNFGSLLVPRSTSRGVVFDALLYDQLAGGAGLCRALLDRWRDLVEAARRRLRCDNPLCTNACHRCLIAFETQRYEEMLRRKELVAFLDTHWEELTQQPERDGAKVAALVRGRFELLETIKRVPSSTITVFSPSIAVDALEENGWLRPLISHAEAGGRLRLVVESIPDPDEDAERFLARRLGTALESGRCEVSLVKENTLAGFGWKVVLSEPSQVFFLGAGVDDGLGANWLGDEGVFYAVEDAARRDILARAEQTAGTGKRVTAADFEPEAPPPGIKWQYVPALEPQSRASFEYWLKGPENESLFARPLVELSVTDPYIATDWQLKLLEELCNLARKAGCKQIKVDTYPPDEEKGRSVRAEEQKDRIRKATGNSTWTPLSTPYRSDRIHKRLLRGKRADGSKFEVLLERGLDFIVERGQQGRTTRETFIIVRDPA